MILNKYFSRIIYFTAIQWWQFKILYRRSGPPRPSVTAGSGGRGRLVSCWFLQKYRRYFEPARLQWFGLYDGFRLRHRYRSWIMYQSGCPWPGPRMTKTYHWLYPPALVWYCFSTPPGPSGRVSSVLVWSEIILVIDPFYDCDQTCLIRALWTTLGSKDSPIGE